MTARSNTVTAARRTSYWRRAAFWMLSILLLPVGALLVWALVVLVWSGVHAFWGVPLAPVVEQTWPLAETGGKLEGLLGPILNTLVLAVTVGVALSQRQQIIDDRTVARAEQITAWMAETAGSEEEPAYVGVVVVNNGSTMARDVDLLATVENVPSQPELQKEQRADRRRPKVVRPPLRNRQMVIPPGAWFLPINRDVAQARAELGDTESDPEDWSTTVAAESGGLLQIALPADQESGALTPTRALGLHLPLKVNDLKRPYLRILAVRFTLDGIEWWRDENGKLSRDFPKDYVESREQWEKDFKDLAYLPLPPAVKPVKQNHTKDPAAQEFITGLAAELTGLAEHDISRDIRYSVVAELEALGIRSLRVSRAGQAIAFYDGEKADSPLVLWLSGNGAQMPALIHLVNDWADRAGRRSLGSLTSELSKLKKPDEMAKRFIEKLPEHIKPKEPTAG